MEAAGFAYKTDWLLIIECPGTDDSCANDGVALTVEAALYKIPPKSAPVFVSALPT